MEICVELSEQKIVYTVWLLNLMKDHCKYWAISIIEFILNPNCIWTFYGIINQQ